MTTIKPNFHVAGRFNEVSSIENKPKTQQKNCHPLDNIPGKDSAILQANGIVRKRTLSNGDTDETSLIITV